MLLLIHPDQKGFMKGRQLSELTQDLIGDTDVAQTYKTPLAVMTFDAAKAFERVNWSFLFKVIQHFDLGETCLAAIKAIYKKPSAKILINGKLTRSMQIGRGTREGCPFSPYFLISILNLWPVN